MLKTIEIVATVVLVGLLILNLSQRRFLSVGEKKRIATLVLSGIVLFFMVGLFALKRNALGITERIGVGFLVPWGGVTVLLAILLRGHFAVFRFRCLHCGSPLGLREIIYLDDPCCAGCRNNEDE